MTWCGCAFVGSVLEVLLWIEGGEGRGVCCGWCVLCNMGEVLCFLCYAIVVCSCVSVNKRRGEEEKRRRGEEEKRRGGEESLRARSRTSD